MTARIISLDKWRAEHPPMVRLAHLSGHILIASLALQRNAWRAWLTLFMRR